MWDNIDYTVIGQRISDCSEVGFETLRQLDFPFFLSILECLLAVVFCAITVNLIEVNFMKISRHFRPLLAEEREIRQIDAEMADTTAEMRLFSPINDFANYFRHDRALNKLRYRRKQLDTIVVQKSIFGSMKYTMAARGLFTVLAIGLNWHSSARHIFIVARVDERVFYPLNFMLDPFSLLGQYGGAAANTQNGFDRILKLENSRAMTTTTTNKSMMLVLYGSETGTAESVAHSLWREARCRRVKCRYMAFDNYDIAEMPQEKLVVFVVATCGKGQAPANMQANWRRLLNRSLMPDYLKQVRMAVFGLGDSSYDKYNFAAKRLYRRLLQLGAEQLIEQTLADDRHPLGVDGALSVWSAKFWLAVQAINLFPGFNAEVPGSKIFRIYRLRTIDDPHTSSCRIFEGLHRESASTEGSVVFNKSNPLVAEIIANRELHSAASDRSCRHVEFLLKSDEDHLYDASSLDYTPGDHLGVFPANSQKLVEKLAGFLGDDFKLDTIFELTDVDDESIRPFPCPCTYETAFTHYTDICSPVRPHVLGILAEFTANVMQREKLRVLASTTTEEGVNEYSTFVQRPRRGIVDILEQFNTCHPPADLLLEVLPRLQPRFYSISSSLNRERCYRLGGSGRSTVSVTLLILKYKIGRRRLEGVCTNYLARKAVGDRCEIFIRPADFRLPDDPLTPVIMIGPGTGFAPFRGFLFERLWLRDECEFYKAFTYNCATNYIFDGIDVGPNVLYVGCRQRNHDYIYDDELSTFLDNGLLTQLHTAFSREQYEKVYVQHRLWNNRHETWRLINEQRASIYICGDVKNMAKDVRQMFKRIFEEIGQVETVDHYFAELENAKRYQEDIWS